MAGITNSARIPGRAGSRVDKSPFGRRLLVARWELVALAAILAVAAILRFWDLGARTFHGDEAIHAGFAWQLADGRGYIHNPLTHGPFQFLGTALVFVLFGDSDYTARVLPALFGTALVGLPFFLRGHLGRTGAIASALLLAVSPTLLYFSRFAREDIYVAFFTLAMFICVWRYLQQPRRLYTIYDIRPPGAHLRHEGGGLYPRRDTAGLPRPAGGARAGGARPWRGGLRRICGGGA